MLKYNSETDEFIQKRNQRDPSEIALPEFELLKVFAKVEDRIGFKTKNS